MARKRLEKEYLALQKDPVAGCTLTPTHPGNMFEWDGLLFGPDDSPYRGGVFRVKIRIPEQYPFQPPLVTFSTKIFHPNISPTGGICLDTLKHAWSPALKLEQVLLSILSLLTDPNPSDPLVPEAADLYRRDREAYNRTAQEWTAKFASA